MKTNSLVFAFFGITLTSLSHADDRDRFYWEGYKVGCEAAGGVMISAQKCQKADSGSSLQVMTGFMGRAGDGALILGGSTSTGSEIPVWALPNSGGGTQSDRQAEQILDALRNGQKAYLEGYRLSDGVLSKGRVELQLSDSELTVKSTNAGEAFDWQAGAITAKPPNQALIDMLQSGQAGNGYILQGVVVE